MGVEWLDFGSLICDLFDRKREWESDWDFKEVVGVE